MFWVHVMIHVNEADVDAFRQASLENARQSREEPGIAQFELVQQRDETPLDLSSSRFTVMLKPPYATRRLHTTRNGGTPWLR